jgi:hypothetical protein
MIYPADGKFGFNQFTESSVLSDFNNVVGFTTFSGDYGDLENTPTNLSDFNNDVGFTTSFTGTNYWVSTAAGIHTLGNVGIGTTNPTTKLQVGGTVTATAFVGDGSGLTNLPGGSGGTSDFVRTSAGIHTLGNLGIGTTSPTSKLTVVGDVLVSGVVTATAFVGDGSGLTNLPGGSGGIDPVISSFMF